MTIFRCPTCKRVREHHAHQLCRLCYERARRPPPKPRQRLPDSLRSIGAALGISHVTVMTAFRAGRLVQTETGWEYTPGVPGRPRK